MILNETNSKYVEKLLKETIDSILDFKLQKEVVKKPLALDDAKKLLEKLPENELSEVQVLEEFKEKYLPHCFNESSKYSMGFPDCGNDSAAMMGSIFSNLIQQNLINQSQSSPSVTFAEINVIQWLREIVGYHNNSELNSIDDVGGIVTPGGTSSNTIAMMLARENHVKDTMQKGIENPGRFKVIVPDGISHYSIRSSLMWIGCGQNIVKVKTKNFKMDLKDLKKKLIEYGDSVMAVVAYVGDSRTMTIDNLKEIHDLVKSYNPNIWLHADACHGFSLGFSEELSYKIKGIELFDSVATDPHKVLMIPYTLSVLLVKESNNLQGIKSESDLIMNEPFAFGQITPFLGSKDASSLKLWFLLKHLGKKKIGHIIEKRHELAQYFASCLKEDNDFIVLNEVEINSVMFLVKPKGNHDIRFINNYNKKVYEKIKEEGIYFLHNFPIDIPDNEFNYCERFNPLRFMSGNPNLNKNDIDEFIQYLKRFTRNKEEVLI
ncbi:pyridoxal-dependent decarboxylase [Bacillus anthracis]|nr:pyridoxal-dependent decarboxylase [Bacillus anthracis]PFD87206.1 pyridoxal-dependent decarboxylase [Bacillus anthracis]PFT20059.1 pyridoxal-dependent decarboxylase [Bacillus thuringiensis]